jgi:carbamoyltransferase
VIVLGIWDGHDAGAALVADGTLVAAVNEERFTRRKLEVRFPERSIQACCTLAGVRPGDVQTVACSTADVAKTIGRLVPGTRERYYRIRRRMARPGPLSALTRHVKYRITEWPPNALTRAMSLAATRRSLRESGIATSDVRIYDHHDCHAVAAAVGSGFDTCAVITIDGVGDGLCATVGTWADGALRRLAGTPARHSPGVFFEHVTTLLNMRELEDEGKVMAMADYAAPIPDEDNPLLPFLGVSDLRFEMPVPGHALMPALRRILWSHPNEQFAAMAQRTLERACVQLARNAMGRTGHRRLAIAGGVASNVKANRLMRLLPEVDDLYVFPHMGDGGLALGAALTAARETGVPGPILLPGDDLAWGPSYTDLEIGRALDAGGVAYERCDGIACRVADLIAGDHIVLWFDGRMEYGPRALGHRSVLARPDRPELRDRLNRVLKRRVWYQPFCPSLLEGDARVVLEEMKGTPNRHMTSAYMVKAAHRRALAGVVNVDGSCRPQIVSEDQQGAFAGLLREMRRRIGIGALLNTSFNIHGQPLVCTPAEALDVFVRCGADALAIGPFLLRRPGAGPPPGPAGAFEA